jgi:dihydropteroate synthase|uniref:Dihydropteroate synthase n=1 Tax=Desulfobacca acetoxidans TaxID=60893 RepID=A0A7C3WRB4_9BACT
MTLTSSSAPRLPAAESANRFLSLLANTARPLIMGIINVTPDSFADGGRFFKAEAAIRQARALAAAGADILDVGGESTRPFSEPVPLAEELRRVLPVIEAIKAEIPLLVSIDTYKAEVAKAALAAGADIINDISALRFDPEMASLAREARVPVVLMHMQGTPRDMQVNPRYDDLLGEIKAFFIERLDYACAQGLNPELLILDPGIGFGKTFDHNLEILNNLHFFLDLGRPLLVGPSRKAFIGHLLGLPAGEERDIGTLAALAMATLRGARIVRVHNVAYARQFLTVLQAIREKPRREPVRCLSSVSGAGGL